MSVRSTHLLSKIVLVRLPRPTKCTNLLLATIRTQRVWRTLTVPSYVLMKKMMTFLTTSIIRLQIQLFVSYLTNFGLALTLAVWLERSLSSITTKIQPGTHFASIMTGAPSKVIVYSLRKCIMIIKTLFRNHWPKTIFQRLIQHKCSLLSKRN